MKGYRLDNTASTLAEAMSHLAWEAPEKYDGLRWEAPSNFFPQGNFLPTTIDSGGKQALDLFSRLLKERIILCAGAIDDTLAINIVGQMLWLNQEDSEKDILLYIMSPGGSVTAGMAIHDTMKHLKAPVSTVALGMVASMAAFLLSAGEKGKRVALPNAKVLIHQPLIPPGGGGISGQVSDIKIWADYLVEAKRDLNMMLAEYTGQKFEKVEADTDRDRILSAKQAFEYGLIDRVISFKDVKKI